MSSRVDYISNANSRVARLEEGQPEGSDWWISKRRSWLNHLMNVPKEARARSETALKGAMNASPKLLMDKPKVNKAMKKETRDRSFAIGRGPEAFVSWVSPAAQISEPATTMTDHHIASSRIPPAT